MRARSGSRPQCGGFRWLSPRNALPRLWFHIDAAHEEVERCLEAAAAPTAEQVELARRYAFTFFFRCMIPFPTVETVEGRLTAVPSDREQLLPGRDPYLDFVCDRILDGEEFVLPDSLAV